jgi:hypothetical protein
MGPVKKPVKKSTKRSVPIYGDQSLRVKSDDATLNAAVQAKLVSLAAKPITPRSLLELEQMTRITRQLIAVGMDPMTMRHTHHNMFPPDPYAPAPYAPSSVGIIPSFGPGSEGTLAPSPPAENWGATIVRELMTLLGNKKTETPITAPPTELDKLIDSIAYAREKGLKDVEDTLLKQLVKMENTSPPLDHPPDFSKTVNGAST